MAAIEWQGKTRAIVDGVTFELVSPAGAFDPTPDRFAVAKSPRLVRHHLRLLESLKPTRIVELGIFRGGSTAMLAAICDPARMLAVDIAEDRVAGLDAFIESGGYGDAVQARYGVDQGDRDQLTSVVGEVMGEDPLDFVLDDASHRLVPTRVSFEVLYPRLRPGGLFVIEDWRMAPMQILSCELVCALASGLADDVVFREHSIVIRRGKRDLTGFSLADFIHPEVAPGLKVAADVWTPERYKQLRQKTIREAREKAW